MTSNHDFNSSSTTTNLKLVIRLPKFRFHRYFIKALRYGSARQPAVTKQLQGTGCVLLFCHSVVMATTQVGISTSLPVSETSCCHENQFLSKRSDSLYEVLYETIYIYLVSLKLSNHSYCGSKMNKMHKHACYHFDNTNSEACGDMKRQEGRLLVSLSQSNDFYQKAVLRTALRLPKWLQRSKGG